MSGCKSTGRFALVDLDARNPAQIVAQQVEASLPYTTSTVKATEEEKAVPLTIWAGLAKAFFEWNWRLRFCSVEWGECPDAQK